MQRSGQAPEGTATGHVPEAMLLVVPAAPCAAPCQALRGHRGRRLPSVWCGRGRGSSQCVSPPALNPETIPLPPPFRLSLELQNSQETSQRSIDRRTDERSVVHAYKRL